MAVNVTVLEADTYFNDNVLWSKEWDKATTEQKEKALTNAENQLYRYYRTYDITDKPIPNECVYEQSLWLLRLDDSIRKAEQGVKNLSVDGINIALDRVYSYIAPEATRILGRRIGRSI